MSSKTTATSRQSKNSRIQGGQTSRSRKVSGVRRTKPPILSCEPDRSRFEASVEWSRRFHQADADEQLAMLGDRDGANWAGRQATKAELRLLARAWHPDYDWYFGVGSSAYTDAERFYFIIHPGFDGDRMAASAFWEAEVTGERETPETAYVQAFAEGAMKNWDEFAKV